MTTFITNEDLKERVKYKPESVFTDPSSPDTFYISSFELDGKLYKTNDIVILDSGDEEKVWIAIIAQIYYDKDESEWVFDSKWFYNANSDESCHSVKLPDNEVFLSLNHFDPNPISTIKFHCDVEFCVYEFPETSKLVQGKYYCRYIYDNKKLRFYRLYTDPSRFSIPKEREAFVFNTKFYHDKIIGVSSENVEFTPENLSTALKYPIKPTGPKIKNIGLKIKVSPRGPKSNSRTRMNEVEKEEGVGEGQLAEEEATSKLGQQKEKRREQKRIKQDDEDYKQQKKLKKQEQEQEQQKKLKKQEQEQEQQKKLKKQEQEQEQQKKLKKQEQEQEQQKRMQEEEQKKSQKKLQKMGSSGEKLGSPLSDSSTLFGSDSTDSDTPTPTPPPTKKRAYQLTKDAGIASSVARSSPQRSPGADISVSGNALQQEESKKLCPYFLCGICPAGETCSLSHEFPRPPLRYDPPPNMGVFKSEIKGLLLSKQEVLGVLKRYFVADELGGLEGLYVIRNCGVGIRSGEVKLRLGKIVRVKPCFSFDAEHQERRFGIVIGCENIAEREVAVKVGSLVDLSEISDDELNECVLRYVTEIAKHREYALPSPKEINSLKGKMNQIKSNTK